MIPHVIYIIMYNSQKIKVKFLKHFLICLFFLMGFIPVTSKDSESVKCARKHSSRVG